MTWGRLERGLEARRSEPQFFGRMAHEHTAVTDGVSVNGTSLGLGGVWSRNSGG